MAFSTKASGNALRYLREIERKRSISAAAEALGISQPALSSYIKKIERQIGAVVIDRSAAPLTLTEVGRAFLDYGDEVERLERDFERKVSDIEGLKCGSLAVGGTASLCAALLPPVVSEFVKRHPGIRVSIIADTLPNLAHAAMEGAIDAFVATSLQDNGAFECTELMRERYFICVPPSWSVCKDLPAIEEGHYAHIGRDHLALLDGSVFVSMQDDQQIGRKLSELLDCYGIRPKQLIRVNQAITGLALTEAGVGISLVTEGALKCCNPERRPALYLLDELTFSRMLYIAVPRNRRVSRAADEFVEVIASICRTAPPLLA